MICGNILRLQSGWPTVFSQKHFPKSHWIPQVCKQNQAEANIHRRLSWPENWKIGDKEHKSAPYVLKVWITRPQMSISSEGLTHPCCRLFFIHRLSKGNAQATEVMSHPGFNQLGSAAARKHSCSSRIDLASQMCTDNNRATLLYDRN